MRRLQTGHRSRSDVTCCLLSDEAAGTPLGDGFDTLAMILGAHQPVLLDELEIGLRSIEMGSSSVA